MASASQFIVEGPVYTFVGLGSAGAYLFLGFSDTGLNFSINPLAEDISVDYAGSNPGDVSQLGSDASVSGTYTRVDPQVALLVSSMLGNSNSGTIPGTYLNNQLGSLWQLEGVAYPVLFYFPYTAKSEFSNEVPGYLFYVGQLNNPYAFRASIRHKTTDFSFRFVPQFGTFNGSTFTAGAPYNASRLYTNNPSNFPSPLPQVT